MRTEKHEGVCISSVILTEFKRIWRVSTNCMKTAFTSHKNKLNAIECFNMDRQTKRRAWNILLAFWLETARDHVICFHGNPHLVHHRHLFKQQERATVWNKELFYREEQIPFLTFCKSCQESKANKKRNIKILLHTLIETDICAHPDNYTTHMPLLPVGWRDSKRLQLQQFVNPVGVEEF